MNRANTLSQLLTLPLTYLRSRFVNFQGGSVPPIRELIYAIDRSYPFARWSPRDTALRTLFSYLRNSIL